MRTNKNLYLFAAALVAGTMGMTSCSNEVVPEVENNPTYNGESVKTQFALNIPAAKNTRMSGTNTQQADNSFLGMQNIKLLPLFATAGEETELKQIITLADIAKGGWNNGDNSKIYSDVNVPVNTNNFLFYAEASATKSAGNMAAGQDAFDQGYLKNTLDNNGLTKVKDITFNLYPIAKSKGFTINATAAQAIIEALKSVATDEWKNYAAGKTEGTDDFADLYKDLVEDLKAGSAKSVKLFLKDLKEELDKLPKNEAYNTTLNAVKSAVAQALSDLNLNTFPQNYNLPDGAVELTWTENVPSYKTESAVIGNMTLKPENICYPASLTYFVNTPLKSTTDKNISWPKGTTAWNDAAWSDWDNVVTAQTTGIALQKVINYAVANLVTTVKCKYSVLEDNAQAMGEPANRKVIVPTQGFTVTGILVGGQPNSVDWQLLPATDNGRDMMVYDKNIIDMVATTEESSENYTLVLDNRKKTSTGLASADDVYIAVEFTNTSGTDFYGADGLVKAGATFYMVAKLDADAATGVSNSTDRKSVFEQDYKTVAKLTIASLDKAYNCIPDLRSTQLQLGMAVDLTWQTGITFDVELGE